MFSAPTAANQHRKELISTFHYFLEEIGIVLREGEVPEGSFLPGVTIENGEVVYDADRLLYPGDILHEAGHVAVCNAAERATLSGNVAPADEGKSGEEAITLLWSWAAIKKTGIPPEVVFHEHGYKDQSEYLIENFENGNYIGLSLLVWAGMTDHPSARGGFPVMKNWLRP
jgi:hypothetical protein